LLGAGLRKGCADARAVLAKKKIPSPRRAPQPLHARWQRQDDFDVYLMPIQWMGAPEGLNDEDEWDELLEFFDEENAAAPRMPLSKY
jgi:hypothetical protein